MRPSRGPRKTARGGRPFLALSLGMLALAKQELSSQLCLLLVDIQ